MDLYTISDIVYREMKTLSVRIDEKEDKELEIDDCWPEGKL